RHETERRERREVDGPRVEEDDLDVEDDERHGDEVVLDREAPAPDGVGRGLDAALVRVELGAVVALGSDDRARGDTAEGQHGGHAHEDEQRDVRVGHLRLLEWGLGTGAPGRRRPGSREGGASAGPSSWQGAGPPRWLMTTAPPSSAP